MALLLRSSCVPSHLSTVSLNSLAPTTPHTQLYAVLPILQHSRFQDLPSRPTTAKMYPLFTGHWRCLKPPGFSLSQGTSLLLHIPIHVTSYAPSILQCSGELLPACPVTIHQFCFCSPPLALTNQRKFSTIQWILFNRAWTPVLGSSPHPKIAFLMEPLLHKEFSYIFY